MSTTIANAISHTSLGLLDPDCVITDYWASETFRTESSTYENGHEVVKFEVLSKDGIKQAGRFYTFTRILGANTQEMDPDGTYVAVKYGANPLAEGMVAGAICGTTAVDLTSVKAQAGMPSSMILIVLGLGATIASAGSAPQGEPRAQQPYCSQFCHRGRPERPARSLVLPRRSPVTCLATARVCADLCI